MAVRKIKTGKNNRALRGKAREVLSITPEIKEVVLDMLDTIQSHNDVSAGLAAPQIGKPLRIIAAREKLSQKPAILINPQITKRSRKTKIETEACLSLPNATLPIERAVKINLEALDIDGKPVKLKARKFFARVIQHEIDHLDGVLIIDKAVKA